MSERLAGEDKSKLLPKATGPFKVIAANPDKVTVDEQGITNIISIDRATAVPGGEREGSGQSDGVEDAQATEEQEANYENGDAIVAEPATEAQEAKVRSEYVVDLIVGHKRFRNKRHYSARWYLQTYQNDTIEPAKNITKHFITCLERQKEKATK